MTFSTQILFLEIVLRLEIPNLLRRIPTVLQMILKGLGVYLLLTPLIKRTLKHHSRGLFGQQRPLSLPTLLRTPLLVLEPLPSTDRADLDLAASAAQGVGEGLHTDEAAVLVLVEGGGLDEVGFVV
jgi:hypothetical protein